MNPPDPDAPILNLVDFKYVARTASSKEEAEKRAVFDLASCAGRRILIDAVDGHTHGGYHTCLHFTTPISVVVTTGDPCRWVDNFLDPEWEIDPRSHPGLYELELAYVYGPSYRLVPQTSETHPTVCN